MPDAWGLAAIVAKFVLYLGSLTAVGTVFAAMLFGLQAWRRGAALFAALGGFGAMASFAVGGAMLTGDASGLVDPEMLALLWSTSVGTALALRLLGLALLLLGLVSGRAGLWISAVGGGLVLWSYARVGHIPDQASVPLEAALLVHLAALALWIGIMSPLQRLARDAATHAQAARVAQHFGRVAVMTVPVLIAMGGYMAYVLVGSVSALVTSAYGQTLLLKIACLSVVLALAALNKFRFVPGLMQGGPKAGAHLATSIFWEWCGICAILATTAVLTSTLTLPS